MWNRLFVVTLGADGAGMKGGGTLTLKLMLLSIFMIFLSIVTLSDYGMSARKSRVNLNKQIPFKCTSCGKIVLYTIRDLQKMQKLPEAMLPGVTTGPAANQPVPGPMMGPMVLDCPQCKQKTLVQAVECPKCTEVFVMKMDPGKNLFDDKCPKCQESYARAWQEKYRKEQGE